MKSYIDPNTMDEALLNARKIRSQAFHKAVHDSVEYISELFTLYNPQMLFRR